MKILRNLGIAFALIIPLAAFATPKVQSCCSGDCCPSCPFCPSGLHK